jgi:sugar/nucleoside kinase (ribokinase family)
MDIVGIGLSNIDLIAHVEESFLTKFDLQKGQAKKLTKRDFESLRDALPDIHVEAGGCAGNMLCGLDKSQIKATFFGKIGNDDYAAIYRDSFKRNGVLFPVQNANIPSSQCAVLITPDGDRTFAYIQGASWTLSPDDIYFEVIKKAALVYTEIYAMAFGMQTGLWPALVNFMRAENKQMALKTVDKEYADLYKTALFALAEEGILTLLIGNAENLKSLAKRDTIEETLDVLKKWKCATILTNGAGGAYYAQGNIRIHHPVQPVENPENTSGAGDQFMAGFLEKYLIGKDIEECLRNGDKKARAVIMSDAPRPKS